MSKDSLTVSELNNWIKDVVQGSFPEAVWICGEIQGYDRNRNKTHIFFELIEKDTDAKRVVARIGLVVFANRKFHIENILKRSENAFTLKDDIEVRFACKVDFYAPHGAVRLVVENIDPTYTLGKLAQEKQKLIAALQKKGVLDKNKQTELSIVPLKIGLITSDDSAAYNDFYSELDRSDLGFKVYLRNATMQGLKTEKDICDAIDELERIKNLDVIVITRGGGSIADLSCFDSQVIAERIAACRMPVLSGIGHEINTTITDLAAHTYAKTPTAIAQFLIHRVEDFLINLDGNLKRIIGSVQEKTAEEKQKLKSLAHNLQSGTMRFIKDHDAKIIRMKEFIKNRPTVLLKDRQKLVATKKDNFLQIINRRIENESVKLKSYAKIIDIVHPVNTLKRGFSITRGKNGKVVRHSKDVHQGDEIITEVVDGNIKSIVKK
ncbi:Exodeoxyribonuclease VII large subunit [hydrothermal vent metagenome]|uniref:Exodeoxyribonuclease VII large subunit n=1 Tax=hydrothermal vent metagenome TaxID=652676 RepID=A0A3B1D4D5_9ZZZZ